MLFYLSKNKYISGIYAPILALSSPLSAAEWDLTGGGYLSQDLAYASYNAATTDGFDGVDSVGSDELFLLPQLRMDNGLQFNAVIEFEGHIGESNARASADEASLILSGAFGQILLGKSDTPGNHMRFGAPEGFGPPVNFSGVSTGNLISYVPVENIHGNRYVGDDVHRGTLGSTGATNTGERTQGRISYFSPRFGGFQLGVSTSFYSPNMFSDRKNFFDLGANYERRFNEVDLGLSANWGIADNKIDPNADPEYYGLGFRVGYRDFTFGGSWAESTGSSFGVSDGRAYDIGLAYERDRWGVSLVYLNGRNTDDENAFFGLDETLEAVTLSARYDLRGPSERPLRPAAPGTMSASGRYDRAYDIQQGIGISAIGFVSYLDFDEDAGDGGIGTRGDDVDGFVIGTTLRLTF